MTAPEPGTGLTGYPPELVAFAVEEAAIDAERVVQHLRKAGIAPDDGSAWSAPAGVLLDVAAALRLRAWDDAGLTIHTEAGLPNGTLAMAILVDALTVAGTGGTVAPFGLLARRVFCWMLGRIAWAGRGELHAEIALDHLDSDRLVEALANLLWRTRLPPELTEGES